LVAACFAAAATVAVAKQARGGFIDPRVATISRFEQVAQIPDIFANIHPHSRGSARIGGNSFDAKAVRVVAQSDHVINRNPCLTNRVPPERTPNTRPHIDRAVRGWVLWGDKPAGSYRHIAPSRLRRRRWWWRRWWWRSALALCARRERPRHCRAAQQRYECAPL